MNTKSFFELRFGTYPNGGFSFVVKTCPKQDDAKIEHPMFDDKTTDTIFNILKKFSKNKSNVKIELFPVSNGEWKSILIINREQVSLTEGACIQDAVAKMSAATH
ncbi:hypothetical protein I3271_00090 [Photobacterium leiognathi]|uniref:hypothetical protein n=1 Tax=Photobacterium leiognathi TaxID=553611 RepID=UPI001EDE2239|nr:hypothetical protein [Photobacterium leiognathi]MCG3883089.1 hypothetical protein [Photobacterium leiognathi]